MLFSAFRALRLYKTSHMSIGIGAESALAYILSTSTLQNVAHVARNGCRERSRLHSEHFGSQIDPKSTPNRSPGRPGSPRGPQCRPCALKSAPGCAKSPPRSPPGPLWERPGSPRGIPSPPWRAQQVAREARKGGPRESKSAQSRLWNLSATKFGRKVRSEPFSGRFSIDFRSKIACNSSANFAQKSHRKRHRQLWRKCVSYRKIQCRGHVRAKATLRERLRKTPKTSRKVGAEGHSRRAGR